MKYRLKIFAFWGLLLCLVSLPARGGVEQLSRAEFEEIARDLAQKVDLFQDIWAKDPTAEFYGGSSRDFLYWVKSQFKDSATHEAAMAKFRELQKRPKIEVREFLMGESDIDILANQSFPVHAETYGVHKIDVKPTSVTDPLTELGKNERLQGHIPAEKIRLGKAGFVPPVDLGDGVGEIYRGVLSAHFTPEEVFKTSHYAKLGANHPILLALRYLRLQSMNYFHSHGSGYPDGEKIWAAMDPATRKKVEEIFDRARQSGELVPYLKNEKFRAWINGTIQKAFRSYTNPTATLMLMKAFGVDKLREMYSDQITGFNELLFAKPDVAKDPFRAKKIRENLARFGVDEKSLFLDPQKVFPDGYLYHGTKAIHFNNIVLQGVMHSTKGSVGPALYGTALKGLPNAEIHHGADRDSAVKFAVSPKARVVDITQGKGKEIFDSFPKDGFEYEKFTEAFGVDILRYDYPFEAYAVKNSVVLGSAQGVYRQVLPLGRMLEFATEEKDFLKILDAVGSGNFSREEAKVIWAAAKVPPAAVWRELEKPSSEKSAQILERYFTPWLAPFLDFSERIHDKKFVELLLNRGVPIDRLLESLLKKGRALDHPEILRIFLAKDLRLMPDQVKDALVQEIAEDVRWHTSPLLREMFNHGNYGLTWHALDALKAWPPKTRFSFLHRSISSTEDNNILKQILQRPDLWKQDLPLINALAERITRTQPNAASHIKDLSPLLLGEATKHPQWLGSEAELLSLKNNYSIVKVGRQHGLEKIPFGERAKKLGVMLSVRDRIGVDEFWYLIENYFSDPASLHSPQFLDATIRNISSHELGDFFALLLKQPHWAKSGDLLEKVLRQGSHGGLTSAYLTSAFKAAKITPTPAMMEAAITKAGNHFEWVYGALLAANHGKSTPALDKLYLTIASTCPDPGLVDLSNKSSVLGGEILDLRLAQGLEIHWRMKEGFIESLRQEPKVSPRNASFAMQLLETGSNLNSWQKFGNLILAHPNLRKDAQLLQAFFDHGDDSAQKALLLRLAELPETEWKSIPWIKGLLRDKAEIFQSYGFRRGTERFLARALATPEYSKLVYESKLPLSDYFSAIPAANKLAVIQENLASPRFDLTAVKSFLFEQENPSAEVLSLLPRYLARSEEALAGKSWGGEYLSIFLRDPWKKSFPTYFDSLLARGLLEKCFSADYGLQGWWEVNRLLSEEVLRRGLGEKIFLDPQMKPISQQREFIQGLLAEPKIDRVALMKEKDFAIRKILLTHPNYDWYEKVTSDLGDKTPRGRLEVDLLLSDPAWKDPPNFSAMSQRLREVDPKARPPVVAKGIQFVNDCKRKFFDLILRR